VASEVLGITRRITVWAGKRASRAIANASREHDASITIPALNIAKAIPDNRIRCIGGPS
jgi:hypothetical protein